MWKENRTPNAFSMLRVLSAFSLFVCSDAHCANCNWMHPSSTLVYFIFFSIGCSRCERMCERSENTRAKKQRMQFRISKPKERNWGDGEMKEYAQVIFRCASTRLYLFIFGGASVLKGTGRMHMNNARKGHTQMNGCERAYTHAHAESPRCFVISEQ